MKFDELSILLLFKQKWKLFVIVILQQERLYGFGPLVFGNKILYNTYTILWCAVARYLLDISVTGECSYGSHWIIKTADIEAISSHLQRDKAACFGCGRYYYCHCVSWCRRCPDGPHAWCFSYHDAVCYFVILCGCLLTPCFKTGSVKCKLGFQ